MSDHKSIAFADQLRPLAADGRKRCTRRVIRTSPPGNLVFVVETGKGWFAEYADRMGRERAVVCVYPRYLPGDMVYIREPWRSCLVSNLDRRALIQYGDGTDAVRIVPLDCDEPGETWEFRDAESMPAWAARNWLRITDVRAERLQAITEEDCLLEGIRKVTEGAWRAPGIPATWIEAVYAFEALWDSIAKPGEKWESNPRVWCYGLEPTEAP